MENRVILFKDREEAGQKLADKLAAMQGATQFDPSDTVVIALPRGGVPVAFEIAKIFGLPLDVCLVRKVSAPLQPELAVAVVSEGKEIIVNEQLRRSLNLSDEQISRLVEAKHAEIEERVKTIRSGGAAMNIRGKNIILVDDGMATGATALSAIHVLKKRGIARLLLAVPVCPEATENRLREEVDVLIILFSPKAFYAVSQFYEDFDQTSDAEVRSYLREATAWSRVDSAIH